MFSQLNHMNAYSMLQPRICGITHEQPNAITVANLEMLGKCYSQITSKF